MRKDFELVKDEIKKAIAGKDEVIDKVLTAILARGHILLDDIPGVGKTTLALACSRALGLEFKRVQFTPDVVPSDIVGFSMYSKEKDEFRYMPGACMCNFLLADEINRTSSKTQSALLEVMQEGKVTVDGKSYDIPAPFTVIATQNPVGSLGTQMLPEASLDRFMIQTSMGYPSREAQIKLMEDRNQTNPLEGVKQILNADDLSSLQSEADNVYTDGRILAYISEIIESTREHKMIRLGISPRGGLAIMNMAKANALIKERDYVVPEDVQEHFPDLARHRILLDNKALMGGDKDKDSVLKDILSSVKAPIL